jgi:hypothetical protein
MPLKYLLPLACLLAACQEPKTPEGRLDKMARGFCECTAQLAQLNKEAEKLSADTSRNAVDIFKQVQAEYDNVTACTGTIVGQYGKLKKEEIAETEKIIARKCPEMARQRDLIRELLGE